MPPVPTSDRIDLISRVALAAAAAVIPPLVFNPGLLNRDGLRMLRGALGIDPIDDWNSPFLTLFLRALHAIGINTVGYVGIQSFAFSLGIVLLCRAMNFSIRATAVALALSFLFPPTIPWLAMVEKSAAMACLIVLLIGLLALRGKRSGNGSLDFCIIGTAAAAMLARPNGLAFVLPLLFFWCLLSVDGTILKRLSASAFYAAISCIVFIVLSVATNSVWVVQKTFPQQPLFVWDLAGISVRSKALLLPPDLYPGDLEMLTRQYNPSSSNRLYWPKLNGLEDVLPVRRTEDPEEFARLQGEWFKALLEHPGAYLKHRARVFLSNMHLDFRTEADDSWHYWNGGVDPNQLGLTSHAVRCIYDYYHTWRETVFFRQFFYTSILGIFLIFFALKRETLGAAVALAALIYVGHHFLAAPASSLRNYYPAALSVISCAIIAFANLYSGRKFCDQRAMKASGWA